MNEMQTRCFDLKERKGSDETLKSNTEVNAVGFNEAHSDRDSKENPLPWAKLRICKVAIAISLAMCLHS